MESKSPMPEVSPNNPCPFLRALAACGLIKENQEKLPEISKKISLIGGEKDGKRLLSEKALYYIAMIANGLNPLRILRNINQGVDVGDLRFGPLDKRGVGSAIIDDMGKINEKELLRLKNYASEKIDRQTGKSELGLDLKQIQKMMDDNFERAKGRRRKIDRALMNGEWPVLLKAMGKNEDSERYLSFDELSDLFINRRFPERVGARIREVSKAT